MSTEAEIDEEKIEAATPVWPREIKLLHPIDFVSNRITSLAFRRGTAGDIKGMKLSADLATNDIFLIASRLCGQPVKVIEMLDVDDAGEVTDIVLTFYKRFLGAGRKR